MLWAFMTLSVYWSRMLWMMAGMQGTCKINATRSMRHPLRREYRCMITGACARFTISSLWRPGCTEWMMQATECSLHDTWKGSHISHAHHQGSSASKNSERAQRTFQNSSCDATAYENRSTSMDLIPGSLSRTQHTDSEVLVCVLPACC